MCVNVHVCARALCVCVCMVCMCVCVCVCVQVVGCGVGQRPVQLAPNERAEWKDLAAGHYRVPPNPRDWDPLSLFNIT